MPSAQNVIPLRTRVQPPPLRRFDLEQMICDAIRERRLLSVVYGHAVEPQTFAPYVLYCEPGKRIVVGGCEIGRRRTTWRGFEVASVRGVGTSERRFALSGAFDSRSRYRIEDIIAAVDMPD